MNKWFFFLLFCLFCMSAHGVSLEFAFQLGEKQHPRLDKLLPNVATQMAFSEDSTKLIVKGMGDTVVSWNIETHEKQIVYTNPKMRCFAFSNLLDFLLIPKSDDVVVTVDFIKGDVEELINGTYEKCSLSDCGNLAVLARGNNEIEFWDIDPQETVWVMPRNGVDRPEEIPHKTTRIKFNPRKLYTLNTTLPVRNGLSLSPDNQYIAAAEGTYREGEGHRTVIELWRSADGKPRRAHDTGEILGVWNLVFSNDGTMLAVDTQLNAKSGIRVWDVYTGAQLLNKSGFEAYWTRALAFAPNEKPNSTKYLASGDEKGNLRIWKIPGGDSVIWETYTTGIQALAFSPDGKYLAVALWDTTIQIYRWKINGK